MTKVWALREFKEGYENFTNSLRQDRTAIQQDWNNYTDGLCKDKLITPNQYETWDNPF